MHIRHMRTCNKQGYSHIIHFAQVMLNNLYIRVITSISVWHERTPVLIILNHFNRKSLCLFFLAVVFFTSCDNDDEPKPETEFEIPSQIINKIEIDANGVKWIATEKGLVSFDGTNWTAHSDNAQLTNSAIEDIASEWQTNTKSIWLAGKKGAVYFDKTNEQAGIVNYNTANSAILSDTVYSIGIDSRNTKFMGTDKGLSIFQNDKWESFFGKVGQHILGKYKISDIVLAPNGKIYVSTQGGGIARFEYTDAVSGATTLNLPWAYGLRSENVFSVLIVNEIEQWYGTDQGVAHHTSEATKKDWNSYTSEDGLVCDTVYAIAQDKTGDMWFGTHRGVSKFDGTNWTNYTSKDGLAGSKVNTIALDLDGTLWFGTDSGISHLIGNVWENY